MSGDADRAASSPIPVTVVGGYLGAGKTTLVNQLLRQAQGLRLAVLVNDFGALPIDADLVEAQDGNVVSIAGGCVCCSYGSDLIAALMDLGRLQPRVEHVLIETSGVALPGQVASALTLLSDFVLDAVVTLVDAGAVRQQAQDVYLADTILRQIGDAQLIILNKCDLVAEPERAELETWLRAQAPTAGIVMARQGAVPLPIVLGRRLAALDEAHPSARGHEHAAAHDAGPYVSRSIAISRAVDVAALATALADPTLGLLRAKGIVAGVDGSIQIVQLAGGRTSVAPAPPGQPPRGLVVIGLAARTDLDRVERMLHAASEAAAKA